MGNCTFSFEPAPEKSFNRGFTSYFADGQREVMWNHDSPKSQGELIGTVGRLGMDRFEFIPHSSLLIPHLHNGDGLVANSNIGFRANRVDGNCIFPLGGSEVLHQLKPGMELRRNLDTQFEQLLLKPSAKRRIDVDMVFRVIGDGVELTISDYNNLSVSARHEGPFEVAQKPQAENYRKQLSKLGETNYQLRSFWQEGGDNLYIPGSILNQLRRDVCELLTQAIIEATLKSRISSYHAECLKVGERPDATAILPTDYKANIHNQTARKLVTEMGIENIEKSFESQPRKECTVMQTRYCLKQALGQCPKYPLTEAEKQHAEALLKGVRLGQRAVLRIADKKYFLKFGCNNLCISEIISTFARN